MSDTLILSRIEENVGILTINKPETLNALDGPTLLALEARFEAFEKNADVHVIVFTGAGDRAFVAGGDIADLSSRRGLKHYLEFAELIHRVFRRIETSDKPTICAINGWALGGGTELLLATDIRYASADAKLGLPEITLGLFPGAGGSQRLMQQIAPCVARELMFTGERITAEKGVGLGLINRIVPKEELLPEVMKVAASIAARSPLVLKLLKRTLLHGADMPSTAALAYEQAMIGLVLDTDDAHEGTRAFLEKRSARFEGR